MAVLSCLSTEVVGILSSFMVDGMSSRWEEALTRFSIQARDPKHFIRTHIMPLLFGRAQQLPRVSHKQFDQEISFWESHKQIIQDSVCLTNFRVTQWFPRAPGVYWTKQAQRVRKDLYNLESLKPEHDPALGYYHNPETKMSLIEDGGIGTIRLLPRRIDNEEYWFASATTTGQCAGGIPLAIPCSLLKRGDFTWDDTVTLYGEVRTLRAAGLEDAAASVRNASPIIVFVDKVESVSKSNIITSPYIITPVVLFNFDPLGARSSSFARYSIRSKFGYTFVQVLTDSGTSLDDASDWINNYADKYSGKVITNFDELSPTLADAPLSYQRLVKKTESELVSLWNIEIFSGNKEIRMGDTFENFSNAGIFVNRGQIIGTINNLATSGRPELASAMSQAAMAIEESKNAAAANLFEAFSKEANQTNPNKSALKQYWDGIAAMLPNVATITTAGAKISELFV